MVAHYSVNLRGGIPVRLPTREAERAYELEVAEARRAQRVPFAVAPRCTLYLPNGKQKAAGEEVTAADFEGATFPSVDRDGRAVRVPLPAWKALSEAVFDGRVLEAT